MRVDCGCVTEPSSAPKPLRQVPPSDEQEDLRPELQRAEEEIWRLRDLLIAKESELGVLRGRLQELESGAAPLITIALRLRMLMPGSLRALLVRLLRRKPS
jgi:hypothetical protein